MADSIEVGWYGKLPSLGDFASRRLPHAFIEAWDAWLAAGLGHWRERDPEGWLAHYLASPSWRFLLMPGAIPGAVVAGPMVGVLMPSVDRVGRYFPLTLAAPLPHLPRDATEAQSLLAWLHAADDLAIDALQDDWSVDELEAELARLAANAPAWLAPVSAANSAANPAADTAAPAASGAAPFTQWLLQPPGAAAPGELSEWVPGGDLLGLLVPAAAAGLTARLHGQAWWLCDDGVGLNRLRISQGLPEGTNFAALLARPAEA